MLGEYTQVQGGPFKPPPDPPKRVDFFYFFIQCYLQVKHIQLDFVEKVNDVLSISINQGSRAP